MDTERGSGGRGSVRPTRTTSYEMDTEEGLWGIGGLACAFNPPPKAAAMTSRSGSPFVPSKRASRSRSQIARLCLFHLVSATRACGHFPPFGVSFRSATSAGPLRVRLRTSSLSDRPLKLPLLRRLRCDEFAAVGLGISKPLTVTFVESPELSLLILRLSPGGIGGSRTLSLRCVGQKHRGSTRALAGGTTAGGRGRESGTGPGREGVTGENAV